MSDVTESWYFVITGGEAKKLHDAWQAGCRRVGKARSAFLKRFGAKTYYGNDRHHGIYAMIFNEVPDKTVWRRDPKGEYHLRWIPRKTTPEGKALAKEMYSFVDPLVEEMIQQVIGYAEVWKVNSVSRPGLEYINGKPIIIAPSLLDSTGKPFDRRQALNLVAGVKQIKASEYCRLKENEKPRKKSA